MADWSELPADILVLITRRLHFAKDYAKFGAICKSWRAVILEKDPFSCSLLPWVMLTDNVTNMVCGFYSPFNKKVCSLTLPEIHGRRCWGSSHGWLVTVNSEYQMHLFNPLSRIQILLPPLHKYSNFKYLIRSPELFCYSFIYKVVVSLDPDLKNCVVLAIYSGNKMAFLKLGDEAWTPLQFSPSVVHDAIYFNGKFYASDQCGNITVCDFNGVHLKTIAQTLYPHTYELDEISTYVVDIGGELHLLLRIMYDGRYGDPLRTWCFKAYKLDMCSEKWEEVKCLGNWCVFVGSNHSFALSICDYPECRRNCIYFTDDYLGLYYLYFTSYCSYDMGVYSLDDHSIQPLIPKDCLDFMYSHPIWMKPGFY